MPDWRHKRNVRWIELGKPDLISSQPSPTPYKSNSHLVSINHALPLQKQLLYYESTLRRIELSEANTRNVFTFPALSFPTREVRVTWSVLQGLEGQGSMRLMAFPLYDDQTDGPTTTIYTSASAHTLLNYWNIFTFRIASHTNRRPPST